MVYSPHMSPHYFEYIVRSGDTLSGILLRMYGVGYRDARYAGVKDQVLALNPHIRHPDQIRAGDILRLTADAYSCSPFTTPVKPDLRTVPGGGNLITENVQPQDRDAFWALSWLEHNANYLTIPGSIAFGASSNLLSPGNRKLIDEVSDLYAQHKSGKITKGQYDYRRSVALNHLKTNLGPSEKWLFGGKTTHESIRIARAGGIPATADIARHSQRLKHLSTLARSGGIVLTGVGLTASCMQIAGTESQTEKNEIFVESVTNTFVGTVSGVAVGLFLISNPAGWGMALVLAAGTVVASYSAGKAAKWVYDAHGNGYDLAGKSGVSRLCR